MSRFPEGPEGPDRDLEDRLRARLASVRATPDLDRRVLEGARLGGAPRAGRRRLAWAAALLVAAAAVSAAVVVDRTASRDAAPTDASVVECGAGNVTLGILFPLSARETVARAPLLYEVRPLLFLPGSRSYVARVLTVLKGDAAAAGSEIAMTAAEPEGDSNHLGSGVTSVLSSEHWPAVPDDPEAGPAWLVTLRPATPATDPAGRALFRHAFDDDFRATFATPGAAAGEPGATDEAVLDRLAAALFASLDDPRADVRASAIRSLRNWDGVPDPSRVGAVSESSLARDPARGRRLVDCARDPDARVRWTAAWLLPREGGDAALERLLFDPVRIVRQVAGYVLGERGRADLASTAASIADYELDGLGSPLATDTMAADAPALLREWLLRHEQAPVRARAAASLGARAIDLESATALAAALASDSDFEVRRSAARALGLSVASDAGVAIHALAAVAERAGEDPRLRAMAGLALARWGDARGVATLALVARGEDARAAAQAAEFLGEAGGGAALAPLREAARDARPAVRAAALVALASVRDGESGEAIAALLAAAAAEDESPYVRAAARAAAER